MAKSDAIGDDGESGHVEQSDFIANLVADARNNGETDIGGIAVADPGAAAGGGSEPKRRGRKPGSGKRPPPAPKAAASTITGIEKLLYSVHAMLAGFTNIPELNIDEKEAALLGASITEVSRHYNAVIDPKYLAWGALIGSLGTVYGTRYGAYRARTTAEKMSPQHSADVVEFTGQSSHPNQWPIPHH